MQTYQIVSGFSDIKSELRRKARIKKPLSELRLWFSLSEGVLYVHDYSDHMCSIVIALKAKTHWIVYLDNKTFGYRLVFEIVNSVPEMKLVEYLSQLHEINGTFR